MAARVKWYWPTIVDAKSTFWSNVNGHDRSVCWCFHVIHIDVSSQLSYY